MTLKSKDTTPLLKCCCFFESQNISLHTSASLKKEDNIVKYITFIFNVRCALILPFLKIMKRVKGMEFKTNTASLAGNLLTFQSIPILLQYEVCLRFSSIKFGAFFSICTTFVYVLGCGIWYPLIVDTFTVISHTLY